MDRPDTDQLNLQMLPLAKDDSRVNRCNRLLSYITSGPAPFLSIFCIGLVSGAAGGLLLGATAVVLLQSLELLADNKLLMDTLEKHIMDDYYLEMLIQVPDIQISIFSVMSGILSSTLSSAVGVCMGSGAYSLVIQRKGQLNLQMPPVEEDNRRVNRPNTLPAFVTSGLMSVVSRFCIGLVSGAAGGLLLGTTAVVLLQSLERLADNSTLINQLEKYLTDDYHLEQRAKHILPWESKDQVHDIHISIFAEMFGVCCSALSLPLGACVGLSAYSLEINRKGEAARGRALAVAGPVCLLVVTVTGGLLGFFFESFLSMTLIVSILLWLFISALPYELNIEMPPVREDNSRRSR
ncbi:uncharacterized protein LOC119023592 [Acanthopagrus latus]|uniref:uncharacterized protein LOC119023592 n=1 Tax=Acanthopagrus latus TaxID=8177 RepID=UPI00187BE5D8|nr:uncharacterized protein LOC119023592 [Acanthopagrus latus]